MTTSSFDRNRCTRISPSAVLDDRLDGKDLEWARDHLRRCEACRERVEDFREMLLRVGRLPSAAVGPAAMDEAFALSIPDRLRAEAGSRSYDIAPPPAVPTATELPPALRPEVSSIPDLLTELEREIFRDEPVQDHPTRLAPMPEPLYPTMVEPEEIESMRPAEPVQPMPFYDPAPPEPIEAAVEPEVTPPVQPEAFPEPLREVPVDSHREADRNEWVAPPDPEPWAQQPEPVDEEPVLPFNQEAEVATPVAPNKPDNAMRIAVGLGAAACVLLAAVLYEGGWLSKLVTGRATAARVTATASLRPSASVRPSVSPSPSLSPTAAAAAPVLFRLGNGVSGGTVYRIRPGTAVAGYTRLVFDIRGSGLPTMVITKPDDLHIGVTFQNTTAAGVPVNGIHSYQVAGIEPAVQQGADGVITVDLARPARVTAFTLAATGSYAWRLVVDVHTS
ncbi:MAG: hypothetical protein QOH92_327 [Chloroflexota bacterium]|jgi:hypothetical protein|nr:hypothetical protein [Chloroflexota bacterium]